MNEVAIGIGGLLAFVLLGFIQTLRRAFGFVDYDKADIEALRERLTRAEEQLNSEIRTNALLQKMIDEQAIDLKRFEERWALAWHQLQERTTELLKTRDDLSEAKQENLLLKSELKGLKEQLKDHDERLKELKIQREEVAAQSAEHERRAILHQGHYEAIPKFFKEMGLDNVIQEWARAIQSVSKDKPDPDPSPEGPGGPGGKKEEPINLVDAVGKPPPEQKKKDDKAA